MFYLNALAAIIELRLIIKQKLYIVTGSDLMIWKE